MYAPLVPFGMYMVITTLLGVPVLAFFVKAPFLAAWQDVKS